LKYFLRTRYVELEGDFRTAFNNFYTAEHFDKVTAARIVKFLVIAKRALEGEDVNLLSVANLLDLIDRYLIWIFPPHIACQRVSTLAINLKTNYPKYSKLLQESLDEKRGNGIGVIRAVYDEVIGQMSKITINNHISFGLQIERLYLLRLWGIITLAVTITFFPLLTNFSELGIKNIDFLNLWSYSTTNKFSLVSHWILFLGVIMLGVLGGFISGILQTRSTKVDLIEFRESQLKFQIKPIVGGLTAVITTVLLSWQILPGIKIESIGSFFLIAFLSGFSERYFLKLLNIEKEKTGSPMDGGIEDSIYEKNSKEHLEELQNSETRTR